MSTWVLGVRAPPFTPHPSPRTPSPTICASDRRLNRSWLDLRASFFARAFFTQQLQAARVVDQHLSNPAQKKGQVFQSQCSHWWIIPDPRWSPGRLLSSALPGPQRNAVCPVSHAPRRPAFRPPAPGFRRYERPSRPCQYPVQMWKKHELHVVQMGLFPPKERAQL